MLKRWRAVGGIMSDLTAPKFKPQTARSSEKRITARLVGRSTLYATEKKKKIENQN